MSGNGGSGDTMSNANERLGRLLGFLESDPDNPALLRDAVQAALDGQDFGRAEDLATRLRDVLPEAVEGPYFLSVVAMQRQDFARAAELLEPLLARDDQSSIRFNLAWSRAMLGQKAEALALLGETATASIPAAAMLKVQLIHEAGDFDLAMAEGKAALERFPDDPGLLGAMSTLALDLEDLDLARACASKGGDHPEALAAAGVLDLQDGDPEAARTRFDRSIAIRPHNPRAWIGRGLASLVRQDSKGAAGDLDQGAQQFGDHIGSWIAAGWAHYLSGDVDAAAQRFERALALDDTFAESHGSLAVIEIAQGNPESARRRVRVALGLDRQCFSAALAQVLLSSDNPERASAIVERAMSTPINDSGLTIASYMAGMARPTVH